MLRLANVMQLALLSAEAPPPQHGAPAAKAELARNPVARRANVILTMPTRQRESANYSNPEPGAIAEGASSRCSGEDLPATGFKLALRQFTRSRSNRFRSRSIVGQPCWSPIFWGGGEDQRPTILCQWNAPCPIVIPSGARDLTFVKGDSNLDEVGAVGRSLAVGAARDDRRAKPQAAHFAENSSFPFFSCTLIVWPSRNFPSRISMLSGLSSSRWMTRFNGRAP
jgi:hypothetical protein